MATEIQEVTTKPKLNPLWATVTLVKRGHRELVPQLRTQLAAQPAIFNYVGNLGRRVRFGEHSKS